MNNSGAAGAEACHASLNTFGNHGPVVGLGATQLFAGTAEPICNPVRTTMQPLTSPAQHPAMQSFSVDSRYAEHADGQEQDQQCPLFS